MLFRSRSSDEVEAGADRDCAAGADAAAGCAASGASTLLRGLQRTCFRPRLASVAIWSAEAMRKLLIGKGCDIQPPSRCTNMPIRSASMAINSGAEV